ncbi:MAG: CHASE2 domain-containing protein, partial [Candidatus Electrothrix sp. AUS4]|nr:CHASE2 domain-containing protein [Candidatus Electrothrix sp. AUS4]
MSIPAESGDNPKPSLVQIKIRRGTGWLVPLMVSLLPTSIIALLSIAPFPFLNAIDLKIYDFLLLSTRSPASHNSPLIVDIDEKSLSKYGQWPWPRFLIAELLEKIQQDEPLAVGLDIMFSEPDRTSLTQIYKNLETHFNMKIPEAQKIPEGLRDNDVLLADVLRQGNFVTSLYFPSPNGQTPSNNCTVHPLHIIIHQDTKRATDLSDALGQGHSILCNLPTFDNAVAVNGFLNVEPDPDGILRRVPLLMKYHGNIYPHLSLATLIAATSPETIIFKTSQYGTSGLLIDKQFIPLDQQGNLSVNFRKANDASRRPFEYISAADLLDRTTPANKLSKKIVFIGTSAVGLNDIHDIPGEHTVPGVEVHANVVDNILNNTFLHPPQWGVGTELAIILFMGLTVAFLFFRFGIRGAILTFTFCGTGLFYGSKFLFSSNGVFLSPLYPALLLLLNFSLIYPIKLYISERSTRKKKEEIARMQEAILEIITALTEARDQETGGHIRRTQGYLRIMAEELQKNKRYSDILTNEEIEVLCKVAPLHDVGKIAVP